MKLASLKEGQFVETGGYYTKGDAGQAKYLIVAAQAADEYGDHTLANGTVAVLQVGIDTNVLCFGASALIDSKNALLSSLGSLGALNINSEILTDPFFFDDSTANITINCDGDGKLVLQNFNSNSVGYANYFTDADIKLNVNNIVVNSLTCQYDTRPVEVGGVALGINARNITTSNSKMDTLKLALIGLESVHADNVVMVNPTGGTTKVRNAQLFSKTIQTQASHTITNCLIDSYPFDNSNADLVKVTQDVESIDQHMVMSGNTFINRNNLSGAQVDIYADSKMGSIDKNTFIDVQLHRKNNRFNVGVPLNIEGTAVSDNKFIVSSGFNLMNTCVYFIGGRGSITGNTFLVKEELIGAVIFLDDGVDDTPEQTADDVTISGNTVYTASTGADTEYFIRRGTPQTGYEGKIVVSDCILNGMKRFANLLETNNSMISNCQWYSASPTGTALSCGILTNFTCDALFTYQARLISNVQNGNKVERFFTPDTSLDIENRTTVFLSTPTNTISTLVNYPFNTPITFISTTGTVININLTGPVFTTLNQYESITYIAYHVGNGATIRWAKSKQ